jgi:mannose-6-phosphate isomerase-like protein (cupin superfamily)
MADATCARIDELESIQGFEALTFRRARSGLGVSSFGISIIELAPNATQYPEHDHSGEGIGGRFFANRPDQLEQEEVYLALRGSGTIEVDGEAFPLDGEHVVRVGAAAKRKVLPGEEGLRLLVLGGAPGRAYEPR